MRLWDYATTRPRIILTHDTPHLPPALSASFNFWSSDTYSQYFSIVIHKAIMHRLGYFFLFSHG